MEKRYITCEAGITLHALHEELGKHHLAMRNLGSISDQTLGGIVTTATHGSGMDHKVLSTYVLSLTLLGNIAATMYSTTLNFQILVPQLVVVPRYMFSIVITAM